MLSGSRRIIAIDYTGPVMPIMTKVDGKYLCHYIDISHIKTVRELMAEYIERNPINVEETELYLNDGMRKLPLDATLTNYLDFDYITVRPKPVGQANYFASYMHTTSLSFSMVLLSFLALGTACMLLYKEPLSNTMDKFIDYTNPLVDKVYGAFKAFEYVR